MHVVVRRRSDNPVKLNNLDYMFLDTRGTAPSKHHNNPDPPSRQHYIPSIQGHNRYSNSGRKLAFQLS